MREKLCGFSHNGILSQDYRISMINPVILAKNGHGYSDKAQALRPNRHRRMAKIMRSTSIRPPLENTFTVECPL